MNAKKTTYLRSSVAAKKTLPPRKENIRKNVRKNTLGTLDETLDQSYWKDSFDKLLDDKPVLKKKSEINASFNRNSSMEDTLPKKAYKVKKRRVKSTEEIIIMADKQLAAVIRKKMLKKQREEAKKIPCSTPISKKMPKGLLLNISAIDAEPQNNSTILYNDVERGPDRSKLHNLNTLFLSETVIGKENLSGNSPEETVFSKPNAMNSVKASGETSNKAKSWRVSRKKTTFIEEEPNSSLIPANDDISNNEEKDSQTKTQTSDESLKNIDAKDETLSDDEVLTVNRFSKSNKRRFYSANRKIMEATTGSVEDNLFDRLKSTSADGSAESSRESQNTDDGLEVSRVLSEEEENSGSKAESDDDIVDEPNNSMPSFNLSEKAQPEELTSPPPVKRPRRSVHFLPNLPEILEITFQDNRASKENNSRRSSRLETTENAAGRKKSSLKTAAASKKSVNFPEQPDIVHEIEVSMTERQPAILAPGKWRKSMALWKKSQDTLRESDEIKSHRRISMFVSNKKDLKRMTQHLQESLSNTLILAQSDETNLSAISILDDSIGRPLHADFSSRRQTRDRSRKTSVYDKSSNLYGVRESLVGIDVVEASIDYEQAVLRRCGQVEPLAFDDIYSESQLPNCRKIGEGVYGEVFMKKSLSDGEPVVLKIIPIEGHVLANGEPQKNYQEILPEIVISMELSNLRHGKDFMTNGFVNVKKVTCVQGVYPVHLLDLWELYRDNHGTENDHPEIFPEDQLYIVFELGNAGQDLEAYNFDNASQSFSAFLQTALTLAVAEQKFEFEHRDLHWGNILLAPTADKFIEFKVGGATIKLPTHGVKATIIDFTLSRMVFEGCCMFNDLSKDEDLFSVLPGGDYQFEIYKLMRKKLDNEFIRFEPFTNTLWLHYMIDKLINGARYRNTKTKKHRAAIHDMMQLRDELLDYKSASEYVKCLF